jgi:hypothetical protein
MRWIAVILPPLVLLLLAMLLLPAVLRRVALRQLADAGVRVDRWQQWAPGVTTSTAGDVAVAYDGWTIRWDAASVSYRPWELTRPLIRELQVTGLTIELPPPPAAGRPPLAPAPVDTVPAAEPTPADAIAREPLPPPTPTLQLAPADLFAWLHDLPLQAWHIAPARLENLVDFSSSGSTTATGRFASLLAAGDGLAATVGIETDSGARSTVAHARVQAQRDGIAPLIEALLQRLPGVAPAATEIWQQLDWDALETEARVEMHPAGLHTASAWAAGHTLAWREDVAGLPLRLEDWSAAGQYHPQGWSWLAALRLAAIPYGAHTLAASEWEIGGRADRPVRLEARGPLTMRDGHAWELFPVGAALDLAQRSLTLRAALRGAGAGMPLAALEWRVDDADPASLPPARLPRLVRWNLRVDDGAGVTRVRADGDQPLTRYPQARASLSIDADAAWAARLLGYLLPDATVVPTAGTLALTADYDGRQGVPRADLRLRLAEGAIGASDGSWSAAGIESELQAIMHGFPATRGAPSVRVRTLHSAAGVVEDILLRWRMVLWPECDIQELSARWAGGTVRVEPFSLLLNSQTFRTRLLIDGIDAAQLQAMLPASPYAIEGRLSGAIPLVYADGALWLEHGSLHLAKGDQAVIRFLEPEMVTAGLQLGADKLRLRDKIDEALRTGIRVHRLDVDLFSPDYPNRPVRMSLSGEARTPQLHVPVENLVINNDISNEDLQELLSLFGISGIRFTR